MIGEIFNTARLTGVSSWFLDKGGYQTLHTRSPLVASQQGQYSRTLALPDRSSYHVSMFALPDTPQKGGWDYNSVTHDNILHNG